MCARTHGGKVACLAVGGVIYQVYRCARLPTQTVTGSATSPALRPHSITSRGSGSTASGSARRSRARTSTGATTSPTTTTSTPTTARSPTTTALIAEARAHSIDVWLDLVPNHTSDQHPWFTDRPEYYVWSDDDPERLDGRSSPARRRGMVRAPRSATTSTSSHPSSPISTGGTPTSATSSTASSASGSTAACAGFRIDVAHALDQGHASSGTASEYLRNRPEVHEIYAHWQEVAAEYDPKPILMGETLRRPLDELPPYWQHLDLAQNFVFCTPTSTIDALRPIVEQTMRRTPGGPTSRSGSARTTTTRGMATRWAQGDRERHRAALFLLLTLPGTSRSSTRATRSGSRTASSRPTASATSRRRRATRSGRRCRGRAAATSGKTRGCRSTNTTPQRRGPGGRPGEHPPLHARPDRRAASSSPTTATRRSRARRGVWAYRRGDKTCALNMTDEPHSYEGRELAPWEGAIL